jgi:uracil-DNA glycosylase|tara:strand:- start:1594 stop:2256 length:663 start_codon:yes stop_codon:yes gene_type:complete
VLSINEPSWQGVMEQSCHEPYYKNLIDEVLLAYASGKVYPDKNDVFKAFELCPFHQTKVVILGQDPYHGVDQAHGLSFSVKKAMMMPPSLLNIFKEIKRDLGNEVPQEGSLMRWAEQGVLLLNAILTVEASQPGSHKHLGWERFTDQVILHLSDNKQNLVFLLWGAFASRKKGLIDAEKHLILTSAHPSPLSCYRGFQGNGHFSKANYFLIKNGHRPITW